MKDEAETKCASLLDEMTEDKRRRADLQRKLREASVEMRAEEKTAPAKGCQVFKGQSQVEGRVDKDEERGREAGCRARAQARSGIGQGEGKNGTKEKARMEPVERKLRSAENMRLVSSLSGIADIGEIRKVELLEWADNEFEYSLIKSDVEDQRRRLENAVLDRSKLMASSGDVVCAEELERMDGTIRSLN